MAVSTVVVTLGWTLAWTTLAPRREAWTLVGENADTAIVLTRLSVANTGLFAEQLTTRALVLPATGAPLEYRSIEGPGAIDANGARAGTSAVERIGPDWTIRTGGESYYARLALRGASTSCPPVPGQLAGVIESEDSDSTHRNVGLTIDGAGVMVHTSAVGNVTEGALYVLTPELSFGIDALADCPAWVVDGTTRWAGAAMPFVPDESEDIELTIGPLVILVHPWKAIATEETLSHALSIERMLSWMVGYRPPTLTVRRASISVQGTNGIRIGVLIERR